MFCTCGNKRRKLSSCSQGSSVCQIDLVVPKALSFQAGDIVRSEPKSFEGNTWSLKAYPSGKKIGGPSVYVAVADPGAVSDEDGEDDDELHAKVHFSIEVVNWRNPGHTIKKESVCTFTRQSLGQGWDDIVSRTRVTSDAGWLGPDGALWLRACIWLPKCCSDAAAVPLCDAPPLREGEMEFLMTQGLLSPQEVWSTSTSLHWGCKVLLEPSLSNKKVCKVTIQVKPPDGVDALSWTPPRVRYNVTVVHWQQYSLSKHKQGETFGNCSGASMVATSFSMRLPAADVPGLLGPASCLWFRASCRPVVAHDFLFLPRDIVLALNTLPVMQDLLRDGLLVKKTIDLSLGWAYSQDFCAVSHCWEQVGQPDPDASQLAAMKKFLLANPGIKYVWYDYCCLPQLGLHNDGRRRSEAEDKDFRESLRHVFILFLTMRVLILMDLRYLSRFWPLWESWLAMQVATPEGLKPAAIDKMRWQIWELHADEDASETPSFLEDMWLQNYPTHDKVLKRLDRKDVKITNSRDKEVQLEVLHSINDIVQSALC